MQGLRGLRGLMVNRGGTVSPELKTVALHYRRAWYVRPTLRWGLLFTLADITLCFAALPFTPRIARSHALATTVLAGAVGIGVFCLVLYGALIAMLIGRNPD